MAEVRETLGRHEERLSDLEIWREKQNGKIDKLEDRLEAKIDRIYFWLIGLMGGMITSLILLITQILAGR
ncbi:MAG: hypothetical protein H5U02_00545 [Clostridia bacterium]|nr:hypothetical protein [Clostridia bacterium]